jgi:hypothetical protein
LTKKGYYGSCSGCDEFLSWQYHNDKEVEIVCDDEDNSCCKLVSEEKAREFVDTVLKYGRYDETKPFLIVDKNIMLKLMNDRRVGEILPANFRFYFNYYDEKEEMIYREIENAIKNHLKLKDEKI